MLPSRRLTKEQKAQQMSYIHDFTDCPMAVLDYFTQERKETQNADNNNGVLSRSSTKSLTTKEIPSDTFLISSTAVSSCDAEDSDTITAGTITPKASLCEPSCRPYISNECPDNENYAEIEKIPLESDSESHSTYTTSQERITEDISVNGDATPPPSISKGKGPAQEASAIGDVMSAVSSDMKDMEVVQNTKQATWTHPLADYAAVDNVIIPKAVVQQHPIEDCVGDTAVLDKEHDLVECTVIELDSSPDNSVKAHSMEECVEKSPRELATTSLPNEHGIKECVGIDGSASPVSSPIRERNNISEVLTKAFQIPSKREIEDSEKARAVIAKTNALREFLARAKANKISYHEQELDSSTDSAIPQSESYINAIRQTSPVPRGLDLGAIQARRVSQKGIGCNRRQEGLDAVLAYAKGHRGFEQF
jgi:hypothetical protein